MQKVMTAPELAMHVRSLVDTFAELLNLADISAYDIQMRAGKNFINIGDGEEEDEEGNLAQVRKLSNVQEEEN